MPVTGHDAWARWDVKPQTELSVREEQAVGKGTGRRIDPPVVELGDSAAVCPVQPPQCDCHHRKRYLVERAFLGGRGQQEEQILAALI